MTCFGQNRPLPSEFQIFIIPNSEPGSSVGIATELRAGWSGIESRWGRNFPYLSTPAQMVTGSFLGVKGGWGMLLTTHPLLVPRSWKSRAIPLPTLQAFVACKKGDTYLPIIPNMLNTRHLSNEPTLQPSKSKHTVFLLDK